jgi:cytochrome c oxidase cbb3-type subunit 2
MSLRSFILGLSACFGFPWLMVVVVPFLKMRAIEPIPLVDDTGETIGVFNPKRTGRIADGSKIYAENGCYLCHTQVVRPTYAGNDLQRPDWGGLKTDEGDSRRETNAFDFQGESFAHIGVARLGPDLSNVGRRVESLYAKGTDPEMWLYSFLYNPRAEAERRRSFCPSFAFLFKESKITGARSEKALPGVGSETTQVLPGPDAEALVSYLLSLKKDQEVPAQLNFAPVKTAAAAP